LTGPAGARLNPELQPLVENLEILNGARGSGLDKAVLMRDLVDLGYIEMKRGAGGNLKPSIPGGGGGIPGIPDDPTVELPTAPVGVYASGGFSNILIAWDSPKYKGHAYAEVYKAAVDDYSKASVIATTSANLYSDPVGTGKTFYYWVRFVNKNDQKGPPNSTQGTEGVTQADIGDILDQLKGQIDESFLTPEFNTRIEDIDTLTKKNEQGIYEIDGKILDIDEQTTHLQAEAEILAEAAMNAASGVDNEAIERRKVTAEIKLVQKTIVSEQGAMAQQILTLTASVDDNRAEIQEAKTAIVKLDEDTQKAVEVITQRLDTQQSELDGHTASITDNRETIVKVDNDVKTNTQSISSISSTLSQLESEVDGNKASITTQQQTIVRIDGEVKDNASGIADANKSISVVSERLDRLSSEVGDNKASITTNSQTIVEVNKKADDNKGSINVLSQQMTTVESELGDTKSQVTTNSQTIAKIDKDGTAAYEAQWGVKASVGDIQAGIGLTAKKNPDGSTTSQCTIVAEQFSVGSVSTGGKTIYPFIVKSGAVYIDTAFIKAASVQELVAGAVIADTVKATAMITAPRIKGGTIEIGSRFTVDENGNMVSNNATMTNASLSGYLNVTDRIVSGGSGSSPSGRKFEVTSAGYLYAENGKFLGEVQADKIVGDVVTAYSKTSPAVTIVKSGSVLFGSVTVKTARPYPRTMSVSLMLEVMASETQGDHPPPSSCSARVTSDGSFGSVISQTITSRKGGGGGDEVANFTTVVVNVDVPTNARGTQNFRLQVLSSVYGYAKLSAPSTNNKWTPMLFKNGADLS
jgi:uncharacterized coiled-coil DUF342 family protein